MDWAEGKKGAFRYGLGRLFTWDREGKKRRAKSNLGGYTQEIDGGPHAVAGMA